MKFSNLTSRILITGGSGLVGSALVSHLKNAGYINVLGISSKDCDLRNESSVNQLFENFKPDFVFHLAARVHGLGGNLKYKSDILVDNIKINTNVVEACRIYSVTKIVAMGSGCVYPEFKNREELFENQVWDGPPHKSEDSYAHSKRVMLAHLVAAEEQYGLNYAFAISGNLYGPGDSFNTDNGHVTPSLVAKFHKAKLDAAPVSVWGSGVAIRDFTYSYDAASALIKIMFEINGPVNLGSRQRHSIKEIVDILVEHTGVQVEWDKSKPDGQLVRFYNCDKLFGVGFSPLYDLRRGVIDTYAWYSENCSSARR